MPQSLLHLVPASLYALLGLHFWRSRWQASAAQPPRGLLPWERMLLAAALLIHGAALYGELFGPSGMRFGFAYAIALMMWLALVVYWIESFYTKLEGLHMLGLPVAAAAALLPLLFPGQHLLTHADSPVFRTHFLMAMLAYSLFTLAALHALIMSAAERRLHRGRLSRALINLPPLLTMEALLFRLIWIAFILLTLTVGSGVLFAEDVFGKPLRFDHKTVFALLSWLIFAGLLLGRHAWGWRGRTALRWTLSGFGVLLLAYVGSRFVIEVVLQRG